MEAVDKLLANQVIQAQMALLKELKAEEAREKLKVKAAKLEKDELTPGLKSDDVKVEHSQEEEQEMEQTDFSSLRVDKPVADFAKLPSEIVKKQLQAAGMRICAMSKVQLPRFMQELYDYWKSGQVPIQYST